VHSLSVHGIVISPLGLLLLLLISHFAASIMRL